MDVAVIKSLPYDLKRKLREDGDIYYGGDKYMLEEFNKQNPGVLDVSTLEKLHARRVGIIVRKGNPLNINGVDALRQGDVNILDVKLGKMRSFYGDPNDELCNVSRLEYTGRQGLSVWINSPDIDA